MPAVAPRSGLPPAVRRHSPGSAGSLSNQIQPDRAEPDWYVFQSWSTPLLLTPVIYVLAVIAPMTGEAHLRVKPVSSAVTLINLRLLERPPIRGLKNRRI